MLYELGMAILAIFDMNLMWIHILEFLQLPCCFFQTCSRRGCLGDGYIVTVTRTRVHISSLLCSVQWPMLTHHLFSCSHTVYFYAHSPCIFLLAYYTYCRSAYSCTYCHHTMHCCRHKRHHFRLLEKQMFKPVQNGSGTGHYLWSRGGGGLSSNSFVQEFFFSLKNFKDPISSSHTWDELW